MQTVMAKATDRTWMAGTLVLAGLAGLAGCRAKAPDASASAQTVPAGVDPASANLCTVGNAPAPASMQQLPEARQPVRALGQRSEAPRTYPDSENYAGNDPGYNTQVADGQDALDAADDQAVYAEQPPPPLPVYEQPPVEQPNNLWTPGYWNYASAGYFWVPGAWVAPPFAGALWTPGYWGYSANRYRFHHGFWGRHIGFYGGVPYGYGYTGYGYQGGYWQGNNFFYNRQINRIDVSVVRNVYVGNATVVDNVNRISYNGPGGYDVCPRPAEIAAYREQRLPAMQTQIVNVRLAQANRQQFFTENRGRPALAVSARPLQADRTLAIPLRTTPAFARLEQNQHAQRSPTEDVRQTAPRGMEPQQRQQGMQANYPTQQVDPRQNPRFAQTEQVHAQQQTPRQRQIPLQPQRNNQPAQAQVHELQRQPPYPQVRPQQAQPRQEQLHAPQQGAPRQQQQGYPQNQPRQEQPHAPQAQVRPQPAQARPQPEQNAPQLRQSGTPHHEGGGHTGPPHR